MAFKCKWAAILLLPVILSAQETRLIFLSEYRGKWCRFENAKALEDAPRSHDPEYVAYAEARVNQVIAISVRRSTEDSTSVDEYNVARNGNLTALKRSHDASAQKVTRVQIWDLRRPFPVKVSETWTQFGSDKPVIPDNRFDDLVERTIITHVGDFPFSSLVADPRRWFRGDPCVFGDASKLETPMKR